MSKRKSKTARKSRYSPADAKIGYEPFDDSSGGFGSAALTLASPREILSWSWGEVVNAETMNARTGRPEEGGLFCQRIFGPARRGECGCGALTGREREGEICGECGVVVMNGVSHRQRRMGHIALVAPCAHIWFYKGMPARMALLLNMAPNDLNRVVRRVGSIVEWIADKRAVTAAMRAREASREREWRARMRARIARISELRAAIASEKAVREGGGGYRAASLEDAYALEALRDELEAIESEDMSAVRAAESAAFAVLRPALSELHVGAAVDPALVSRVDGEFGAGALIRAGTGPEAVRRALANIDFDAARDECLSEMRETTGAKRKRAADRLRVVEAFRSSGVKPEWMVLTILPVLPPDLRPMIHMDSGRMAADDLNDLYRRVIHRNNRLKDLIAKGAPGIILNNEKRMLQEAVDAVIANDKLKKPALGRNGLPLKSISQSLKGKSGIFRQNLLGKRVDYSGRSVISVGPDLLMRQCGLPRKMALELFKPFVEGLLIDGGYADSPKAAEKAIKAEGPEVWEALEEVASRRPVILNRAPSLHRLSFQAFDPVLIEGGVVRLHSLVCTGFNADFDGDQMAVHAPLSREAVWEARRLMSSMSNMLSPASGEPVVAPTLDMVMGCFWLTQALEPRGGAPRRFASADDAMLAYEAGGVPLRELAEVRMDGEKVLTTVGRIMYNDALDPALRFRNEVVDKGALKKLAVDCAALGPEKGSAALDRVKALGFRWATMSGGTIAFNDVALPDEKAAIVAEAEEKEGAIKDAYLDGLLTEEERYRNVVQAWTDAGGKIAAAVSESLTSYGSVAKDRSAPGERPKTLGGPNSEAKGLGVGLFMMSSSGAKGNLSQLTQMAGMRGLMANARGQTIERPVKSNFREGLPVLEYFISTRGARKGLCDTALRTAEAGYMTRKLVDVSHAVVVAEDDCGTDKGRFVPVENPDKDMPPFADRVVGRCLARAAVGSDGAELFPAGTLLDSAAAGAIAAAGADGAAIRSPLECETPGAGICRLCYGASLSRNALVAEGEAAGVIASQSIGEPGTQLTMRTFHSGGVAGADITTGLPRVKELFEAMKPKGEAPLAPISGEISISWDDEGIALAEITSDEGETASVKMPRSAPGMLKAGARVSAGDALCAGSKNPHDLLEIAGLTAAREYIIDEVQRAYRSQGVDISDKHIEIIVSRMQSKREVVDGGGTGWTAGDRVDAARLKEASAAAEESGGRGAESKPALSSIVRLASETESWLSAASFQQSAKALSDAAVRGAVDPLVGLKENVILGRLIPANLSATESGRELLDVPARAREERGADRRAVARRNKRRAEAERRRPRDDRYRRGRGGGKPAAAMSAAAAD